MKILGTIALALSFALPGASWSATPESQAPEASRQAESAKPASFHRAQTTAEQTLDRIFTKVSYLDIIDNTSGRRPRTAAPADAPYLKYLTRAFATSILAAEADLVKHDCHGIYESGELCGLDFDPITCAQDVPDFYLFRTIKDTPNLAVIDVTWPSDPSVITTYRLTRDGHTWKVDGISCELIRFNWQ